MKIIESIGEVLPNGYLVLPDAVRQELVSGPHRHVKVMITVETSRPSDEQKGWEVFRGLGRDAHRGQLPNASTRHDQYLYTNQT